MDEKIEKGKIYNELFKTIEQNGTVIDFDQKERIIKRIDEILSYVPKVGIFGKTGVGKSSLCNALFGSEIANISDVEACTRHPQEILLNIGNKNSGIKLIDVPGVGENEERDKEYHELYKNLLPEIDIVLWILKGDDRAFSDDQKFYKYVVKPHLEQGKPFLMVINQIDKVEPFREWNIEEKEPGIKQRENINKKKRNVADIFEIPISKVIEVSANEKYNLIHLVDEMIFALPADKKITVLKEVKKEYISEKAVEESKKGFVESIGHGVGGFVGGIFGDKGREIGETVGGFIGKCVDKIFEIKLPWSGGGGGGGGGCFITTATLNELGKEDNCYELNLFRNYRDTWLIKTENGAELIDEYYKKAPIIVQNIDKEEQRKNIYSEIWNRYLIKCMKHIENEEMEEAKQIYIDMVKTLEKKWV